MVRHFRKRQTVRLYTKLFTRWPKIQKISRLTLSPYRDGTFVKMLLKQLPHFSRTQWMAYQVALRMTAEP